VWLAADEHVQRLALGHQVGVGVVVDHGGVFVGPFQVLAEMVTAIAAGLESGQLVAR
jgi:hypothetical protein